jgi:hypothetical protein
MLRHQLLAAVAGAHLAQLPPDVDRQQGRRRAAVRRHAAAAAEAGRKVLHCGGAKERPGCGPDGNRTRAAAAAALHAADDLQRLQELERLKWLACCCCRSRLAGSAGGGTAAAGACAGGRRHAWAHVEDRRQQPGAAGAGQAAGQVQDRQRWWPVAAV